MSRPRLEVADVFHQHGAAWRRANVRHVSLGQLTVMSAIERCRSAALGGHAERCQDCGHSRIAYNSCRNRHCPKCQGAAAKDWLAARESDLLPVGYFHLVFTLPAEIAPIAYQNKAVVYDLLFRAAAETLSIGSNQMPRFAVSMERVRRETRTVIVEADDEQQATAIAVENDFDEDQLDDWDPLDPEDPEVYDVFRVEDDQPLTPASTDCEGTNSL